MKHSRSELVKCIVGTYLKRRKYTENENYKKHENSTVRGVDGTAISAIVDYESALPNSIMYKCVNNDPGIAESQFACFKVWIAEQTCLALADELKTLLFPLLCHICIEMLSGGHKAAASAFLKKHQSISSEEGFHILEELASLECTKEIDEKEILKCLRSSKYQVTLSGPTMELLKQYLIKKAHVILLQIINSWFDLEETKTSADSLLELIVEEEPGGQANGFQEHLSNKDGDQVKIEEIIRILNEGPSSPAPLLLYSVTNPENSISCGIVSNDRRLLAGGYISSDIRLWSLSDEQLEQPYPSLGSRIKLAVDLDAPQVSNSMVDLKMEPNTSPSTSILQKPESILLLGHTGPVQGLAFVPQSRYLVSVSLDKTMRAWDLDKFTCGAIYRGHNYPIWCVEPSPLLGYVATGSHDRTARLWSLDRNFPLRLFAGHQQDVDCLRFHPNGNYLATGSSDNSIRLWSVDSGEMVRVLDGHRLGVTALAFSPDGSYLASAGGDRRVKVWDLKSSSVIGDLRGHLDCIISLDWSPNGEFLVSSGPDNTARVWPIRNLLSGEDEPLVPKVYSLNCNSVISVKYSSRNTPMCIVGQHATLFICYCLHMGVDARVVIMKDVYYVPWFNLDEWLFVKELLQSKASDKINEAYSILLMWKARLSHLPGNVECTIGILQALTHDPQAFQFDTIFESQNELCAEKSLTLQLVYSTSIMRFINHTSAVSSTQGDTMYLASKKLKIPSWVVGLRHDVAHSLSLPSLDLLRSAANFAFDWLLSNYWQKQDGGMTALIGDDINVETDRSQFVENLLIIGVKAFSTCRKAKRQKKRNVSALTDDEWSNIVNFSRILKKAKGPYIKENLTKLRNIVEVGDDRRSKNSKLRSPCEKVGVLRDIIAETIDVLATNDSEAAKLLADILPKTDFLTSGGEHIVTWQPILNILIKTDSMKYLFENLLTTAGKGSENVSLLSSNWLKVLAKSMYSTNNESNGHLEMEGVNGFEPLPEKLPHLRLDMLRPILLPEPKTEASLIKTYVGLLDPPAPKRARIMLKKLVNLYKSEELATSSEEAHEPLGVDDLITELKSSRPIIEGGQPEGECNGDVLQNGFVHGTETDVSMQQDDSSPSVWKKISIDIELWRKVPLGLLPDQVAPDFNLSS